MINPPQGPSPEGSISAEQPRQPLPLNVPISELEQKSVVDICNKLKTSLRAHASTKKKKMRDCYAYSKSTFVGKDLLPAPSTDGSDRDIEDNRPKVFIPVARQIVKTLYSGMKLSFFPNDEDYMRVRAKTEAMAQYEDNLTEGLKYVFKEALISEKVGLFFLNLITMSNAAAFPTIRDDIIHEWKLDEEAGEYVATVVDTPPMPDLEILNPLYFYSDPTATDPERSKWGYFFRKKKQELKDSNLYFNKEKLDDISSKSVNIDKNSDASVSGLTGVNSQFEDTEDNVDYDLFYFPYLKTNKTEYRNMLVGVAGGQVLCRFHPNLFPRGMNPGVFTDWMPDPQSNYGIGPVEDVMEIQRLINIIYNYVTDTLARIGNRYAVAPGVDTSQFFGVAGGFAIMDNPGRDMVPMTGDYSEPAALMNFVGTLKAEAQITSGAQNPFQGAANIDFKKTATEIQALQENSISVLREVIEHVSVMGVQRIFERLMYLCADLYKKPLEVRIDDPATGTRYMEVDFSIIKSGEFTMELIGANPSQSKQAQVESLTQLLELVISNPEGLALGEPIIQEIGKLQGLKNLPNLIDQLKETAARVMGAQNGQGQSGVPNPQAGEGAPGAPPVGPVPQA